VPREKAPAGEVVVREESSFGLGGKKSRVYLGRGVTRRFYRKAINRFEKKGH
jgi:hypothetical protein